MILEAARRLFNERGYAHVTMRDIASECSISVGNLTYHFHRKRDVVSAIMEDSFAETLPEEPIRDFAGLHDQFDRMLGTITRNAFYFLDDEFIGDSRGRNAEIRKRILKGLEDLVKEGLLCEEMDERTREGWLEILLMAHLTWLRETVRGRYAPSRENFLELHLLMLEPYLTDKGRKCLK